MIVVHGFIIFIVHELIHHRLTVTRDNLTIESSLLTQRVFLQDEIIITNGGALDVQLKS